MKSHFFPFLLLTLIPLTACGQNSGPVSMKDQRDSISYSIGQDMGKNFRVNEFDLNPELVSRGFQDGFAGLEGHLTEEQTAGLIRAFQMIMQQKQMEAMAKRDEKQAEENEKFLNSMAKKPGIQVTPSGLMYKMVKEGTGRKPGSDSKVRVHYRGTLTNGQEFDSSYKRGEPIEFSLDGVIAGWTEGILLMKEGGKIELIVPPNLGYGNQGNGPIPPGSILLFEVELLGIVP
ncbi:MAG: FKBP-type peptidyl-prolyl cis-trans isomerase [Bacteroidetes bacterium]|nr:FKBP-type peptidyl-prolyl cis-trans isomerase [Bacteroidota bacterium]